MYDGREISNFILDYCDILEIKVSNLALQKILYFCHAEYLVRFGEPLIRHKFEAWTHGPVLQYVYHDFSQFSNLAINSRSQSIDNSGKRIIPRPKLSIEREEFLKWQIAFYARMSAAKLRELSHIKDGPWYTVWNHEKLARPGMYIENACIVQFFSQKNRPYGRLEN